MIVWPQLPRLCRLLRPADCRLCLVSIPYIPLPHSRRRGSPFRQQRARVRLGFRERGAGVGGRFPGRDGSPCAGFGEYGVAVGFRGRVGDRVADLVREVLGEAGVGYWRGRSGRVGGRGGVDFRDEGYAQGGAVEGGRDGRDEPLEEFGSGG